MQRRTLIVLAAGAALAGCGRLGRSRLNPLNWFGGAEPVETVAPLSVTSVPDPRPLVPQVVSLDIERKPGGAVVRAVGLPPTQGWFDAALLPVASEDLAVLTFQFRAMPPPGPRRVSTPRSRELVVAAFVSDQTLAQVREVRVAGAANALASRR